MKFKDLTPQHPKVKELEALTLQIKAEQHELDVISGKLDYVIKTLATPYMFSPPGYYVVDGKRYTEKQFNEFFMFITTDKVIPKTSQNAELLDKVKALLDKCQDFNYRIQELQKRRTHLKNKLRYNDETGQTG